MLEPKRAAKRSIKRNESKSEIILMLKSLPYESYQVEVCRTLQQSKKKRFYDLQKNAKSSPMHYFSRNDKQELVLLSQKKELVKKYSKEPQKQITKNSSVCTMNKTWQVKAKVLGSPKKTLSPIVPKQKEPKPTKYSNNYETWKVMNKVPGTAKVFIISGNYQDVRENLLQRGWYENPDTESMFFDLKWTRNARIPAGLMEWQYFNHFERNFELSTKVNLSQNMKKLIGTLKVNSLKFFPRCFKLGPKGNEEFVEVYKTMQALNMLKKFTKDPTSWVPEKIMCCVYIIEKWVKEIEKDSREVRERPFTIVFTNFWKILNSEDLSEIKYLYSKIIAPKVPNSTQELLSLVSETLEKLRLVDPQYHINGENNIWIIKPGRKSRGRDIVLFKELESILDYTSRSSCWVVQKYIENPLIIQNKKFDIRQWVLVSSSDPLTVWIYSDCYLRFGVDDYDQTNLNNLFIHLTNNCISKESQRFSDCEIKDCMWHIEEFRTYLKETYGKDLWETEIFPSLKKIIKWTLQSVGRLGRKNSFEVLGFDFMVDENMKPWLIEVNSSPAMDYSTSVTESLVKQFLSDVIKVIVDCNINNSSDTGKFVLCFKERSRFN